MKTLIITAVAMSLGLLSSPTFAGGSVVGSHAMPIVDPDPWALLFSSTSCSARRVQIEDKSKTDWPLPKLGLRRY